MLGAVGCSMACELVKCVLCVWGWGGVDGCSSAVLQGTSFQVMVRCMCGTCLHDGVSTSSLTRVVCLAPRWLCHQMGSVWHVGELGQGGRGRGRGEGREGVADGEGREWGGGKGQGDGREWGKCERVVREFE